MLVELSAWVNATPVSLYLRRITWLIPMLQTVHILSFGIVLASVVMMDLRIWGVSRSGTAIARSRRFMPWMWAALAIATITGIAMMFGSPRSWRDTAFAAKLWMMAGATVATVALPFLLRLRGDGKDGNALAQLVGLAALVLWLGATLAGRGRWFVGWLGV
jgi:hypothetical protein